MLHLLGRHFIFSVWIICWAQGWGEALHSDATSRSNCGKINRLNALYILPLFLTAAIGSLFQKFVFGLILKVRELNLIVENLQCPLDHGDSHRCMEVASEPGSRATFILLPLKADMCFKWNFTWECFPCQIPYHLPFFLCFHHIKRDRHLHRMFFSFAELLAADKIS